MTGKAPPSEAPPVTIGTIGRPHGVRGDLKLYLADPTSQTLSSAPDITLKLGHNPPQTLRILSAKPVNKCWIVRLEGVTTREAAAALTGALCSVLREHLPLTEEDEFYYCDLIGFSVVDEVSHQILGQVLQIFHNGAHEVLIYGASPRQSEMIPFLAPFVTFVDTEQRLIHIRPLSFDE